MSEFKKAYIYKISCKDQDISDCYIGSTFNFSNRYYTHKTNCINKNNNKYKYKVYQYIKGIFLYVKDPNSFKE